MSKKVHSAHTKAHLGLMKLGLKSKHENEDHDHLVMNGVEIVRVDYGETDLQERGVGEDLGPQDVRDHVQTFTRAEVTRIVRFAIAEAPMLRRGYISTSVTRIIDTLPRLDELGVVVLDHDGKPYGAKT